MAAELPRPGVEVIQVFRAVSPTVVTPTLVPAVVGVGKQVVELLEDDGAGGSQLNPDALITLPGFFIALAAVGGPPAVYSGLDTLLLAFNVNNGPTVTITFQDTAASGLTPASVVSQINAQLATAGVTSVLAELVGTTQFQLRTVGVGEFQQIVIASTTSVAVATAFGIGIGKTYVGIGNYNQRITNIPETAFPDPRNNLGELAIESTSIRAFIATGNGTDLSELKRTQAFCRNGLVADSAAVVGTVDIDETTAAALYGVAGTLIGTDITLKVDGGAAQSYTVPVGGLANDDALAAAIQAAISGITVMATAAATPSYLLIVSNGTGNDSSIEVIAGGTMLALVGLVAGTTLGKSIEAIDDGNGDQVTPLIFFENLSEDGAATATPINFNLTPTAASVTGSGASLPPAAGATLIISDGNQVQTIVFLGTETTVAGGAPDVKTTVEAIMGSAAGGKLTISNATGQVKIDHSDTGTDSVIDIIGGTALTALGLSIGTSRGVPSKPEPGDQLWIEGQFFGNISVVHPGGATGVLKVDTLVPISLNVGSDFFIEALNLPSSDPSRPDSDLTININGDALLKQEFLRDTTGYAVSTLRGTIYLSYTAVRKDVTSLAALPGLLRFDDVTALETALAPISTENPLALGLFFALLNAPGAQVSGLGVDAISSDSPFGTVEAFTRAAEYLEAFEVYAIAPLTHDGVVHQVFKTHVDVMSEPENKGERIVLINPSLPTRQLDSLVASGSGDSSTPAATVFDTGIANLSALVLNAGVSPTGTIPATAGLFLDIAADAKIYSIASISGSKVTIRTVFATGENDDAFYSTTDLDDSPLSSPLIQEAFGVKVRGAELVTVTGAPDNQAIAETLAGLGATFLNRRVWMLVPDQARATINGLDTLIDGFYMAAAIVGMIAQQPPQQSFTNFPMTGFTEVVGTSQATNRFTERQKNIMAAGGAYIVVQDTLGAPLISRFALTTDLTSIETRTDSITKVVDFTAKFLRRGIRNFIGRFNITQGFLDTLGNVLQGLGGFLVEQGVLIGFNLNNIIQDEDAPDTVLVDITLDVPYPANFIRLTLVV